MTLYRDSERVSPTGNITSRGVLNPLGRPHLDPLAVLVREAVQNSWDARAETKKGIIFGAAGWTMSKYERNLLRQQIFTDLPPTSSLPLSEQLNSSGPLYAVAIYDRGTTGLGGPTRADTPSEFNEPRDFVDFLRNVGQPPDKQFSGGTYGYGKAAFYRVSYSQTICVFTRCIYRGRRESRFMASALGEPFADETGVLHTGRHWWGQHVNGIAEPLIEEAEQIAHGLGMQQLIGPDDLGTVILIIQPRLEQRDEETGSVTRTPGQSMQVIAENLLLYFWPKMLSYDQSHPAIRFEVSWEGVEISLPQPQDFEPLKGFVNAMYRLKGYKPSSNFPSTETQIRSERPRQLLGALTLQMETVSTNTTFDTGERESAFARLHHHTALLRSPEFVVKYLSGPMAADPRLGMYGVFLADPEVDRIYADAEPPAHDDWVADGLAERTHRVFINVTHKRIMSQMEQFVKPGEVRAKANQLTPLGAFSSQLGKSLLPSIKGTSASVPFSTDYKPPRPSTLTIRQPPPIHSVDQHEQQPKVSGSGIRGMFDQFRALMRGEDVPLAKADMSQPAVADSLEPPPVFAPGVSSSENGSHLEVSLTDVANGTHTTETVGSTVSTRIRKPLGRSKVVPIGSGEFVLVDNQPALKVRFSVTHGTNAAGTDISVFVRAIIDGGAPETEMPVGGSRSEVLRWLDANEKMYLGSSSIFLSVDSSSEWSVVVSLPEDLMIDVTFDAVARGQNE